jgi:hypothetical protein
MRPVASVTTLQRGHMTRGIGEAAIEARFISSVRASVRC